MKTDWEIKTLGEVSEYISRGISPKYTESKGLMVINQKCIRNHTVNLELARLHDKDLKSVSPEKLIKNGDILINSTGTGTLGRVAQVTDDIVATVDSHVTIVRPDTKIFDKRFFAWALFSLEKEIEESGAGASGQTELSRESVENFSISYPKDKKEQKRIVKILDEKFGAIEELKTVTEQQIVDVKELFESRLNEVFKNNRIQYTTLNVISVNLDNRRVPITKNVRKSGSVPYYGASGIVDYVEGFIFEEDLLLVSEDGANLLARTYPIAFSISGKTWVNNHAHVLKFENIYTQKFIEFYINSISVADFVTGAAQPKLNQAALNKIPVPQLPLSEQKQIVKELDELSKKTNELEAIFRRKIADLEELKKSYLQQAFSGNL